MQLIKVSEFPRLRGEEAIVALYNFVGDLKKQSQFKKIIIKYFSESFRSHEKGRLGK